MGTMTCSAAPAIRLSALDARTFAVRQSRRGLPADVLDGDVTPAVAWLIAAGIVLAAAGLIAAGLGAHSFIAADVPTASQTAAPATRHDRLVAAPAPHDRGAKPATPSRRDVPPVTQGRVAAANKPPPLPRPRPAGIETAPATAGRPASFDSTWRGMFDLAAPRDATFRAPQVRLADVNAPRAPDLRLVSANSPQVTGSVPAEPIRRDSAPVVRPVAKLAALAPVVPAAEEQPRITSTRNGPASLLDPGSRTAIYDIAARTVYLPNGDKLEAHSGLGSRMDDPGSISLRNRGVTPPNVYDLRLRAAPFHGVRAIRMVPVDDGKMFGRDGILAHSYMLGPSGQSNGCVSFKDYNAFLQAFLRGEVDRMIVVASLANPPASVARRGRSGRYASNRE